MRMKATAVMLSVMTLILAVATIDIVMNRTDPVPDDQIGLIVAMAVLLTVTAILTVISIRMAMNEVPEDAGMAKVTYMMPADPSETPDDGDDADTVKGKMPREAQ